MRAILISACLTAAACGELPANGVPGLHGYVATATSDRASPNVLARMGEWRATDEDCVGNAYGGIAVTGDVGGDSPGPQTVLASFDEVIVVDANGALVAAAPTELECSGSADAIEVAAIGRTFVDVPVIAIAATVGGRAEQSTFVLLYRVSGRALVPMFTGAVQSREGGDSSTGGITFVPDGLVYRAPGNAQTWWRLDSATGRYVAAAAEVAQLPYR